MTRVNIIHFGAAEHWLRGERVPAIPALRFTLTLPFERGAANDDRAVEAAEEVYRLTTDGRRECDRVRILRNSEVSKWLPVRSGDVLVVEDGAEARVLVRTPNAWIVLGDASAPAVQKEVSRLEDARDWAARLTIVGALARSRPVSSALPVHNIQLLAA